MKLHRKNLRVLAEYLDNLPDTYGHFNMTYYNGDRQYLYTDIVDDSCGTSACAVGHGPYAGFPIEKGEDWNDYSERVFIEEINSPEWDCCFSGGWASEPEENTPKATALRIRKVLVGTAFTRGEFTKTDQLIFLPIEDISGYINWDMDHGFAGGGQVELADGIVVRKDNEDVFLENIIKFLEKTE